MREAQIGPRRASAETTLQNGEDICLRWRGKEGYGDYLIPTSSEMPQPRWRVLVRITTVNGNVDTGG